MMRLFAIATLAVGLCVSGASLVAHHSFAAEFDEKKPVTLKGTITRMEWVNPHSWLHINVTRPDGKVDEWMIEFGAPNALYRRGWKKESLPIGAIVTVEGWMSKTDPLRANAGRVVLPDGKELFAGSSGTGAPSERR